MNAFWARRRSGRVEGLQPRPETCDANTSFPHCWERTWSISASVVMIAERGRAFGDDGAARQSEMKSILVHVHSRPFYVAEAGTGSRFLTTN